MKKLFLVYCSILPLLVFGQYSQEMNGRWCISGSHIMLFTVHQQQLNITLINQLDAANMSAFLKGEPIRDTAMIYPISADKGGAKLFMTTQLRKLTNYKNFLMVHDTRSDSTLTFIGDMYYDTIRVKKTSTNCNTEVPICRNYLFTASDLAAIQQLKPLNSMKREDVFEVFNRFEALGKTLCNRCHEAFPGAYFSRILIQMGFNPIYQTMEDGKTSYDLSSFDVVKDLFIVTGKEPKDPELYNHYKGILNRFWGKE